MKKTIFGLLLLFSVSAFAANPAVDEKIMRHFSTTYPEAKKIKWFEYETFYEVLFEQNNIVCRMKYDTEGKMVSVRRDYTEQYMPLYLLGKVKESFPDKKVFGITEITDRDGGLTYTIILEDAKRWTTVLSDASGQMYVTKRLRKA